MFKAKRKVRSNGKTVIGQISSAKRKEVQFESSIEEGFIYILDFDSDVKHYHDQPVQIAYKDVDGKDRIYTPDFLVEYRSRSPVLFEVKSQEYIRRNPIETSKLVELGTNYAKENGWDFELITEKEVKTDYGDNVRDLFRYQTYTIELSVSNLIIHKLERLRQSTPHELIKEISEDIEQWPVYIAAIWALIFNKRIGCDLFKRLHMDVPIWVTNSSNAVELKYPYKP